MFKQADDKKKLFIERTRAEREKRKKERLDSEQQKKDEKAALTLQKWWRRQCLDRRTNGLSQCWTWWNNNLQNEEGELLPCQALSTFELFRVMGLYCLLSRRDKTNRQERLAKFSRFMLGNSKTSSTIPYLPVLTDKRYGEPSLRYLCIIVQQALERVSFASQEDFYVSGPEFTMLLHYLNPNMYLMKPSHNSKDNVNDPYKTMLTVAIDTLFNSVLCRFDLREYMSMRVQYIVKIENRASKVKISKSPLSAHRLWLTTISRIALFPVEWAKTAATLHNASVFLWSQILATPLLVTMINSEIVDHVYKWTVSSIHASLRHDWVSTLLGGNGCLFLLGNVVDLWRRADNGGDISNDPRLIQTANTLLRKMEPYFSHSMTTTHQTCHPLLHWAESSMWGNSMENAVFERVLNQIEHIWSRQFIDHVFSGILAFNHVDQTLPDDRKDLVKSRLLLLKKKSAQSSKEISGHFAALSVEAQEIFGIYKRLRALLPDQQSTILLRIAFTPQLMPQLWRVMNYFGPHGQMSIYLDAARKENAREMEKEPLIDVLRTFCEACSLVFITFNEVDLFQNATPFSAKDLLKMSAFLNKFFFALLQQDADTPALPASVHSFKAARKLLLQIYDLDVRHPFCPSGHWLLVPDNKAKSSLLTSLFSISQPTLEASHFIEQLRQGNPVPLRILQLMPHTIPFQTRLKIFRDWTALDRASTTATKARVIKVRRNFVLEDGFRALANLPLPVWKERIQVSFVNDLGVAEAGIDQGGPFKDFITLLMTEVSNPTFGLFDATPTSQYLHPSPSSASHGESRHIELFEFIGKIIGRAVYEGILLDVQFAQFVLAKLLGRMVFLEELRELDEELWRNLTFLKHYEGNVEELGLTFAVDEDLFGKVTTHELKFNGKHLVVTNDNRVEYVFLVADYKLNRRTRDQTSALVRGFRSVVSKSWVKLFSPQELQRVISGEDTDFDVSDLRRHTQYQNGYFDQHPVIRTLWSIVQDFSTEDRRAFLKFVTSCSKPPLGGFDYLKPAFSIRLVSPDGKASGGADSLGLVKTFLGMNTNDKGRLPTSSTCFNLLKLPAYTKKVLLREKLKYAIHSNTGFELS